MAINKDSKAYQSLLDKGYTDEQITQMHDAAVSGENTKDVVANTQANDLVTVWPMNANLNYFQYWDDSNPAQQWQKWWMNEKYTGEWVKTSNLEYDENIKTSDLDPNYLYWEAAKNRNSKEAWYIARRNDMIASALYNEWKTSKEDVANFLSSQNEWMNSTEADRANTIESVWKRLWEMQPKEEEKPDISVMEEDLNKWNAWKIYGKTTADEWNPSDWIITIDDANSVYKIMNAWRIASVEDMLNLGVDNLAAMMYTGSNTFSEMAWRDFRKYYPDMASKVDQKVKELRVQDNVAKIAKWDSDYVTTADNVNTDTEATSYAVNATTSWTQATQLLKSIDSILESNDTAKSAQDLMGSIENDMAVLKNRLKNLRTEANNAFKWDVPDYIVNAYINNKSQEIQNQLSILEDRYNAAYNRYKTELSHAEWESEYQLKKDSLALDEWKAKNGTSTTTSSSSQNWRMRTESNNNPTAMTTDYAKMMWLELWVDYEIWDAFVWQDWRTYYTARFLWDPIETAIKAFDRWAANNVFGNQWGVLWHWNLWISNQKWLSLTDWKKRDVIYKILQKEGGNMDYMSYYLDNNTTGSLEWWEYSRETLKAFRKFLQWEMNSAEAKVLADSLWVDLKWLRNIAEKALQSSWELNWEWETLSPYAESVLVTLAQLYNIAAWDDWKVNFRPLQDMYTQTERNMKYAQIKSLLTLEQMTEARANEIWFWQVTEWEWKMLKEAATALGNSVLSTDSAINWELEKVIQVLWKASYWTDITQDDWINYRNRQKTKDSWNDTADLDYAKDINIKGWDNDKAQNVDDDMDKILNP